jgi:hypothetical protein
MSFPFSKVSTSSLERETQMKRNFKSLIGPPSDIAFVEQVPLVQDNHSGHPNSREGFVLIA